jgi:membrane protease YdiL (CAAX protease family)
VRRELLVLGFAMIFPMLAAFVYFGAPGRQPLAHVRAVYSACKLIQFSLPIVWLAAVDRAAIRTPRLSLRGVPFGLVFGLLVAALIFGLYHFWIATSPAFAGLPATVRAKVGDMGARTPAGLLVVAAFLSIPHSLLEEYYWRWFVYGRLRHCRVPRATALVLAGLAFMGHHVAILGVYFPDRFWLTVLPFSLAVAVGGIVWAWLYERTGSLLAQWLSHAIVDVALMAVGYDLAFGRG